MEIFTAVQGQSVRGSDIALSEMSSLEFASSWSLMNIVFSFHFVLPVFNAACLKRWPNSIGNYRILHVDWCFFLHGSAFSTIFEYFVICPFFFFFTFNGLPSWQSWQPIWWEKILSLFWADIKSFWSKHFIWNIAIWF